MIQMEKLNWLTNRWLIKKLKAIWPDVWFLDCSVNAHTQIDKINRKIVINCLECLNGDLILALKYAHCNYEYWNLKSIVRISIPRNERIKRTKQRKT